MASQKFDDIYKIVILGEQQVGKTTFLSQYIPPTNLDTKNHINDMEAQVETLPNGQTIDVQVWDLSGDPSYRSISEVFTKHSLGAFVLFDLSNPNSLNSVSSWVHDLRTQSKSSQVFIIGNKKDLQSKTQVQYKQAGQALARSLGAEYFEVNSLNKAEVNAIFKSMISKISLTRPVEPSSQPLFLSLALVFVLVVAYYVLG